MHAVDVRGEKEQVCAYLQEEQVFAYVYEQPGEGESSVGRRWLCRDRRSVLASVVSCGNGLVCVCVRACVAGEHGVAVEG